MKSTRDCRTASLLFTATMSLWLGGCGPDKVETAVVDQMPIDEGVWTHASTQRDCSSLEIIPVEDQDPIDIVCAQAWQYSSEDGCSLTRSGNTYSVDCTVAMDFPSCRVELHMVGTILVADRRHYTVDGTINLTATPGGCWEDMYGETEGCISVHEVHVWQAPLEDGDCAKSRPSAGDPDEVSDPARLFRAYVHQALRAHGGEIGIF